MYCWTWLVSNWDFNQSVSWSDYYMYYVFVISCTYHSAHSSSSVSVSGPSQFKSHFQCQTFFFFVMFVKFYILSFFLFFLSEDCIITLRKDFPMPSMNHSKLRFNFEFFPFFWNFGSVFSRFTLSSKEWSLTTFISIRVFQYSSGYNSLPYKL